MPSGPHDTLHVAAGYQSVFRRAGLDAEAVFTHPQIQAWRRLPDRENCTLDTEHDDGSPLRLHIKRYPAQRRSPAEDERRGIQLLQNADIPTVPLVAWGKLRDGRSFLITEDLAEHAPADKLIAAGMGFDLLLATTANLAARLHAAGLHHRDLYLCHFFARKDAASADALDLRLIDAARVARFGRWLGARWITKDLAQFWYSTLSLSVTDGLRGKWLDTYAAARGIGDSAALRRAIERKAGWIARHDAALRKRQPNRNISIPEHTPR